MRPKGFALLPILIIVVLLGVGGYFIYQNIKLPKNSTNTPLSSNPPTVIPSPNLPKTSPTSDPTANWKTLFNKNGFSIKYPSTLKVLGEGMEVDETNAPDIIIASNPGNTSDTSPALHINISPKALTVYKDMTLAEISKVNYEANQANKNTFKQVVAPLKSTTFDGKPAYTYTLIANGYSGKWSGWIINASINKTEKLTVIETENNGNYFIIAYSADDPTIALVLSTFKFTE